jgi:hypothetical protein
MPTAAVKTGSPGSATTRLPSASPSASGTDATHPQGAAVRPHQQRGEPREDVKEYYFYLDSTPTHSYARMLYKYPQGPFRTRAGGGESPPSRLEFEYELLDTGIFDQDRYWDVFVEYAKADPEDVLIRISVVNRGPEAASLHVLPQLWFRNTWGAGATLPARGCTRGRTGAARHRGPTPGAGDALPLLRGRAGAALHGERYERGAPARPPESEPLRQGRDQRLRGPGATRGREPRSPRDEGGRTFPRQRRAGAEPHVPAAPHAPRSGGDRPVRRRVRADLRGA